MYKEASCIDRRPPPAQLEQATARSREPRTWRTNISRTRSLIAHVYTERVHRVSTRRHISISIETKLRHSTVVGRDRRRRERFRRCASS